jgi:hypothetical protein
MELASQQLELKGFAIPALMLRDLNERVIDQIARTVRMRCLTGSVIGRKHTQLLSGTTFVARNRSREENSSREMEGMRD